MKHLIKKVDLRFFQDNTTGEYGLAHADTLDNNGSGFNAFWNGIGIFHDVFEHSHEHANKYFRGDYAMNVGGEMAAMGGLWYYYNVLGVYNRMSQGMYYTPGDIMKRTTMDMVSEAITDGNTQFGNVLESNVPKQSPVCDSELEYQIADFWKTIKNTNVKTDYKDDRKRGRDYKKSVTFRKIADLHRYGFRMAEKFVPDNRANADTLCEFLEFFDAFCKNNSTENLQGLFRGMIVKVYKNENDEISWTATLTAQRGTGLKDYKITNMYNVDEQIEEIM